MLWMLSGEADSSLIQIPIDEVLLIRMGVKAASTMVPMRSQIAAPLKTHAGCLMQATVQTNKEKSCHETQQLRGHVVEEIR